MNCRRNVQLDQFFSQLRSKLKNVYAVLPGEKLFGLLSEKKNSFLFFTIHSGVPRNLLLLSFSKKKNCFQMEYQTLSLLRCHPPGFLTSRRSTSLLVFRGQVLRGLSVLSCVVNDHDFCIAKTEDLNQPHWFYEYAPTPEVLGLGHATAGCLDGAERPFVKTILVLLNLEWTHKVLAHWAAKTSPFFFLFFF